ITNQTFVRLSTALGRANGSRRVGRSLNATVPSKVPQGWAAGPPSAQTATRLKGSPDSPQLLEPDAKLLSLPNIATGTGTLVSADRQRSNEPQPLPGMDVVGVSPPDRAPGHSSCRRFARAAS